ncbi:MAG TPA: hypothetical protein PLA94_05775, partial [Myxococcota bacterium]|nr:hypothetical protein [Myxococcota bacterium]
AHTDGASEMEGPAPTLPEVDQESGEEESFFGEDEGLDAGPEPIGAVEASSPAPAPRSSWWVAEDLPLDQGEEPPPLPAEPEPAPLVEPEPEELPPPIEPPPERALWEEEPPASDAPRPTPLPAPAVALVWDLEAEAAPPVEEPPQPTWDLPDWELE